MLVGLQGRFLCVGGGAEDPGEQSLQGPKYLGKLPLPFLFLSLQRDPPCNQFIFFLLLLHHHPSSALLSPQLKLSSFNCRSSFFLSDINTCKFKFTFIIISKTKNKCPSIQFTLWLFGEGQKPETRSSSEAEDFLAAIDNGLSF